MKISLLLALVLTMTAPVLAQMTGGGKPLGIDPDLVLPHAFQEGTPGVRDRYTLTFKALPFATNNLQVLYYSEFTGKLGIQGLVVKGLVTGASYPVKYAEVDTIARAVTIQLTRSIPKGETPVLEFDEVQNPNNDGVYQFRARVLQGGLFPAYFYLGDWFITLGGS